MEAASRKHLSMPELIAVRRADRMAAIDNAPADLRELFNEYGGNVVNAFLQIGVKKPRHIKHLVETVLDEFSPTRGSFSNQGKRTEVFSD